MFENIFWKPRSSLWGFWFTLQLTVAFEIWNTPEIRKSGVFGFWNTSENQWCLDLNPQKWKIDKLVNDFQKYLQWHFAIRVVKYKNTKSNNIFLELGGGVRFAQKFTHFSQKFFDGYVRFPERVGTICRYDSPIKILQFVDKYLPLF